MSFEAEGGSVTIKRFFTVVKPEWEVDAYADIKQLYAVRQAFDDLTLVVKREG